MVKGVQSFSKRPGLSSMAIEKEILTTTLLMGVKMISSKGCRLIRKTLDSINTQ